MIKRIRHLLPLHAKLTPYHCLPILLLDYADTLWGDKNNHTFSQGGSQGSAKFTTEKLINRGSTSLGYNNSFHSYQSRKSNDLHLPRVCTNLGKQTFIFKH